MSLCCRLSVSSGGSASARGAWASDHQTRNPICPGMPVLLLRALSRLPAPLGPATHAWRARTGRGSATASLTPGHGRTGRSGTSPGTRIGRGTGTGAGCRPRPPGRGGAARMGRASAWRRPTTCAPSWASSRSSDCHGGGAVGAIKPGCARWDVQRSQSRLAGGTDYQRLLLSTARQPCSSQGRPRQAALHARASRSAEAGEQGGPQRCREPRWRASSRFGTASRPGGSTRWAPAPGGGCCCCLRVEVLGQEQGQEALAARPAAS